MAKPILLVVHDDRDMLAALEQQLQRRFSDDYQVLAESAQRLPWRRSGGSVAQMSPSRCCSLASGCGA